MRSGFIGCNTHCTLVNVETFVTDHIQPDTIPSFCILSPHLKLYAMAAKKHGSRAKTCLPLLDWTEHVTKISKMCSCQSQSSLETAKGKSSVRKCESQVEARRLIHLEMSKRASLKFKKSNACSGLSYWLFSSISELGL